MYYEEEIINGVLMCRNSPRGEWLCVSVEKMSQRIIDLEMKIRVLESRLYG